MAFYPTVTVGSNSYVGLGIGTYQLSSSTPDEPVIIEISKPTIKPDGKSYASVVMRTATNGTAPSPDVSRQTRVSFNWDSGATQAELEAQLTELKAFLTTGNITKMLRGEQ
jgi:hypothetical protein